MVKALVIPAVGAALQLVTNQIKPAPQAGEVLVRTHAVALNPFDWKQAKYGYRVTAYPANLGQDYAGVVESVGAGVVKWSAGDRVYGWPKSGTFNEYVVSSDALLAKIPDNLSFEQAATINLGAATSFVALYRELKLPRPQEHKVFETPEYILIWGGASSTGAYAIQLARLSGLKVITTASAKNHAYLKSLGADYVVDYSAADVVDQIRAIAGGKLRYAYDTISAETGELAAQALDQDVETYLVYITGEPAKLGPKVKHSRGYAGNVALEPDFGASFYTELEVLIRDGKVVPNRVEILPNGLEGIPDGLAKLEKGVSGVKLVAVLDPVRDRSDL